jgi:hypothetical protein
MTTNNSLIDYLNSPEAKRLHEALEESRLEYEESVNAFWEGLSYEEREQAFYHVCKNIHRGDVLERTSYRGVIYDIFGFDSGSYTIGMDCGYMDIHNMLGFGLDLEKMKTVDKIKIGDTEFTKGEQERLKFELSEDGKELLIKIVDLKTLYPWISDK